MSFTPFDALKSRRGPSASPRHRERSRQSTIEQMEGRQMLSGTPLAIIDNPIITEGTGETSVAEFRVALTRPAPAGGVTINYDTVDNSAKAGQDYTAANGKLIIPKGERTGTIRVELNPDSDIELTESFGVTLSNARGAFVITPIGVCTILDDDTPVDPELTVHDVSMMRGFDGATKTMTFRVELNTTYSKPISVRAGTSNLTARAGADYQAKSEVLTFEPGERVKEFKVKIHGTSKLTSDKIFLVSLSDSIADLTKSAAVGVLKYGK